MTEPPEDVVHFRIPPKAATGKPKLHRGKRPLREAAGVSLPACLPA